MGDEMGYMRDILEREAREAKEKETLANRDKIKREAAEALEEFRRGNLKEGSEVGDLQARARVMQAVTAEVSACWLDYHLACCALPASDQDAINRTHAAMSAAVKMLDEVRA